MEENDQLVPQHIGSVRYPILQDEHIQCLVGRPHVDPHVTVESLHHELNEVFISYTPYLSIVIQKPFEVKLDLILA